MSWDTIIHVYATHPPIPSYLCLGRGLVHPSGWKYRWMILNAFMLLPSFTPSGIHPDHSLYNPIMLQYGRTLMIMDIIDANPLFIRQYIKWRYEEWSTLQYGPIPKVSSILEEDSILILFNLKE